MKSLSDTTFFRVSRPAFRAIGGLLSLAAGYFFVLNNPSVFAVVALLYFVVSRRKKWKESGRLSRAKSALVDIATAAYVAATAILIVPPVYYALLMNRYVMGAILCAVLFLYVTRARRTRAWIPVPLSLLAALSLPSAILILFWAGTTDAAARRILRGVDVVTPVVMDYPYNEKSGIPNLNISSNDLRRMVSGGGYLYVTLNQFSGKSSGLLRVDLGDLKNLKLLKLPGCHNLAISRDGSAVYAAGYRSGDVYVVGTPRMRLLRKIHVARDRLQEVVLGEDRLLVSGEQSSNVYIMNLKTGRVEKAIRPPFMTMISVMKKNPRTGRVYSRGDLMMSGFSEVDAKKGLLRIRKMFPWGMGFEFSPDGKTVFLNDSWFGLIHEVSLNTFRTLRKFRVRPGLRDVEVDSGRGLIYAGNYPDGYLDIVDYGSGKPLANVYLGKRVRCIYLTPDGRLFVISMYGLFEIDVDKILRKTSRL